MRIWFLILLLLGVGCSFDRFEDAQLSVDPLWSCNSSISDLSGYAGMGTITDDVVVSGWVISSDSTGNIYKKLYIEDSESVVVLCIGLFDLYERYPVGANVNLSLKGAAVGVVDSVLQIGYQGTLDSTSGEYGIETINSPSLIELHLQRGIGSSQVSALEVSVSDLTAAHTGHLLSLEGLFSDGGEDVYSGSQAFVDDNSDKLTVYTSSYSSFASDSLAEGRVRLVGILAYYSGKQQLLLRSLDDVTPLE
ncbi:MAG: DUF5689 domain-containing protein [Rikenellaceae bacterium]